MTKNEGSTMIFTLPYPPSANRYWRNFRGRMVVSSEARQYKNAVRLLAKSKGFSKPYECSVSVSMEVFRPRRIGDLDNTIKVTLDALQGIAYVDDSQVTAIHAHRNDDKENPRVVVTVKEKGNE